MKEQCDRESRRGETCGRKLPDHYNQYRVSKVCKTCQDIQIKSRRKEKEEGNLRRWSQEPHKFRASIEKSEYNRADLIRKVRELNSSRPKVVYTHFQMGEKQMARRAGITASHMAAGTRPSIMPAPITSHLQATFTRDESMNHHGNKDLAGTLQPSSYFSSTSIPLHTIEPPFNDLSVNFLTWDVRTWDARTWETSGP